MSFSYQLGANPTIDYIRLLVTDTQDVNHVFEDEEINIFWSIQNGTIQSGMRYSGVAYATLPNPPASYLRVAALALDALAGNKARLSSIMKMLDVTLDPSRAAAELRNTADQYRKTDDESGAFIIAEQVHTVWSFRDRFWASVQRANAPA